MSNVNQGKANEKKAKAVVDNGGAGRAAKSESSVVFMSQGYCFFSHIQIKFFKSVENIGVLCYNLNVSAQYARIKNKMIIGDKARKLA